MAEVFKVPLLLMPQPDGGYTVTSPALPELVTEGDTVEGAIGNVQDALAAVIELYEDLGKPFPANLRQDPRNAAIWFEGVVASIEATSCCGRKRVEASVRKDPGR